MLLVYTAGRGVVLVGTITILLHYYTKIRIFDYPTSPASLVLLHTRATSPPPHLPLPDNDTLTGAARLLVGGQQAAPLLEPRLPHRSGLLFMDRIRRRADFRRRRALGTLLDH